MTGLCQVKAACWSCLARTHYHTWFYPGKICKGPTFSHASSSLRLILHHSFFSNLVTFSFFLFSFYFLAFNLSPHWLQLPTYQYPNPPATCSGLSVFDSKAYFVGSSGHLIKRLPRLFSVYFSGHGSHFQRLGWVLCLSGVM